MTERGSKKSSDKAYGVWYIDGHGVWYIDGQNYATRLDQLFVSKDLDH